MAMVRSRRSVVPLLVVVFVAFMCIRSQLVDRAEAFAFAGTRSPSLAQRVQCPRTRCRFFHVVQSASPLFNFIKEPVSEDELIAQVAAKKDVVRQRKNEGDPQICIDVAQLGLDDAVGDLEKHRQNNPKSN